MSVLSRKKASRSNPFVEMASAWRIHPANDVVPSAYFRWKGIIGRLLAVMLLIPGAPIIAGLVVLVRLTSRGPGIHRQTRVGKGGQTFTMYKIRTMRHDAEAGTGAAWARQKDARITSVGRILRKLHLDEFPQLFNVLKGQMCLIGPRPERPEFVHVLVEQIPGYGSRLLVPPGITGLAQINLPPDSDLNSVRRKLALDVEYVKHAGLLLDVRMFLCTSVRLLGIPGVYAMRMFGLRREVAALGYPVAFSNGASVSANSFVTPAKVAAQTANDRPDGNGEGAREGRAPSSGEPEAGLHPKPR